MDALERTMLGYTFQSHLTLGRMKEVLGAKQPQKLILGDSEWHGDYIGWRVYPQAVTRIYALKSDANYNATLRFVTEAGDTEGRSRCLAAETFLREKLMPAVPGRNVQPAEPIG